MLTSGVLEKPLFRAIIPSTSQPGQIEQDRHLCARLICLWWKVEVQSHVAISARSLMLQLEQLAAERGNGSGGFERHDECVNCSRKKGDKEMEVFSREV